MLDSKSKQAIEYAEKTQQEGLEALKRKEIRLLVKFYCLECKKNHFFAGTNDDIVNMKIIERCPKKSRRLKIVDIWEISDNEFLRIQGRQRGGENY